MANPANAGKVEEFTVRVPERKHNKNYHLMKFRNVLAGGKDDPSKWGQVRMIRENNKKEFKGPDEDMPKYGAGSEYVRAHHIFKNPLFSTCSCDYFIREKKIAFSIDNL